MSTDTEPNWPKLLSLAVHELRTPITVAAGYLRMILRERAGPISEQQRKLLEEAEKSCARLSGLVSEMSELSAIEGGRASLTQATIELNGMLAEQVASLPELPDREVRVELETNGPVRIQGDATRLRTAFSALITALRREVIDSERMIVRINESKPGSMCVITIGTPGEIDGFAKANPSSLGRFDEWRGGSGLSLPIARRVIGQHGGAIFAPPDDKKAGAVILLPHA